MEAETNRAEQNRTSALGHAGAFLTERATPEQITALRTRFGLQDLKSLESRLETEIHSWINGQTNEELLQYDPDSIREHVFAQLLSWC
jgi:hypothetical protein